MRCLLLTVLEEALFHSKVFQSLGFNQNFETKKLLQNGFEIKDLKAKSYIQEKVSMYGSTLPAEAYTETATKMVTDTLDKKTQDKTLMEMMDDFYNGRFEKYI